MKREVKNLIVCGVEGSGHHALVALLRSNKPELFSIHVDGDFGNQPAQPRSDLMLQKIADENKAWDVIVEIPRRITRFFGLPGGLTVATPVPPRAQKSNHLIEHENAASRNIERRGRGGESFEGNATQQIEVYDSSIPFLKGINRSHLNHLDYFSMGITFDPRDTRVLFLTRDPVAVSYSIFRRGICTNLLTACRSTEVSMAIFQQALLALRRFESLELRYEELLSEPSRIARTLERFLNVQENSLDERVIVSPTYRPEGDEKAFLDDFWSIRPAMTLLT